MPKQTAGLKASTRASRAEHLAARMAIGSSITFAASEISCPESTARRIASTPEFQARVRELRAEQIRMLADRGAAMSGLALRRLQEVLMADRQEPAIVVRAASAILRHLPLLQELAGLVDAVEDLRTRLDRLESGRADSHRKGIRRP